MVNCFVLVLPHEQRFYGVCTCATYVTGVPGTRHKQRSVAKPGAGGRPFSVSKKCFCPIGRHFSRAWLPWLRIFSPTPSRSQSGRINDVFSETLAEWGDDRITLWSDFSLQDLWALSVVLQSTGYFNSRYGYDDFKCGLFEMGSFLLISTKLRHSVRLYSTLLMFFFSFLQLDVITSSAHCRLQSDITRNWKKKGVRDMDICRPVVLIVEL